MKFNKTVQVMQKLGSIVVDGAKKNLKKKQTKSNTLYNGIDYVVKSDKDSVEVVWGFGRAADYWDFVDQGVKGSGGYSPRDKRTKEQKAQGLRKTGSGLMRGAKSGFSFKGKNIARGVVLGWIKNKPLKLRNTQGQFIEKSESNMKSAAFVIGRAIAQRGLTRTLFFTNPYNTAVDKYEDKITQAFADDLEIEIEKQFKD
tara:strand:+ start:7039 stop:7638 length:600 start_codon:yes stop_codon:yes gene_type:complete